MALPYQDADYLIDTLAGIVIVRRMPFNSFDISMKDYA